MRRNETSTQFHYPGMNYMGPGTHIIKNVEEGVKPVSYTDSLSLAHDINYLLATGSHKKMDLADQIAQSRTGWTNQDAAMLGGLELRQYFHLKEKEGIENKDKLVEVGRYLRDQVLRDEKWKSVREEYDIKPSDFISTIDETRDAMGRLKIYE